MARLGFTDCWAGAGRPGLVGTCRSVELSIMLELRSSHPHRWSFIGWIFWGKIRGEGDFWKKYLRGPFLFSAPALIETDKSLWDLFIGKKYRYLGLTSSPGWVLPWSSLALPGSPPISTTSTPTRPCWRAGPALRFSMWRVGPATTGLSWPDLPRNSQSFEDIFIVKKRNKSYLSHSKVIMPRFHQGLLLTGEETWSVLLPLLVSVPP